MAPIEFLREGWGKVRRYYLSHYRKSYVERMLKLRRGACRRCGACCSVMIRCPYLKGANECGIYERRFSQCRLFPIDRRDLRGRFSSCGYYFVAAVPERSKVRADAPGMILEEK